MAGAKERWRKVKAGKTAAEVTGGNASNTATEVDAISNSGNSLPVAKWPGELEIRIACYVLDDKRCVIGYDSFTVDEWLAWMRLLISDHRAERANLAHKPFPIDLKSPPCKS